MEQQQFNALVLGASGAVGRELVRELTDSDKWAEITLIVRRELPQWKDLKNYQKLKIINVETLDSLQNKEKWNFENIHVLFCLLGGRTKDGKKKFTQIDYQYPYWGAEIAKQNNIRQFSLLTSRGSNPDSMFLYLEVKGKIEKDVANLNFPIYSIFRPGLIKNRDNDSRCGEKFASCLPCIAKIESKDLARAIRIDSEMQQNEYQNSEQSITNIYENRDIIEIQKHNKD